MYGAISAQLQCTLNGSTHMAHMTFVAPTSMKAEPVARVFNPVFISVVKEGGRKGGREREGSEKWEEGEKSGESGEAERYMGMGEGGNE